MCQYFVFVGESDEQLSPAPYKMHHLKFFFVVVKTKVVKWKLAFFASVFILSECFPAI